MKIQDILFVIILIIFLWRRNPRWLVAAGLSCLILSIPLFYMWVFFTAQRLVYYAAGFLLFATLLSLPSTKMPARKNRTLTKSKPAKSLNTSIVKSLVRGLLPFSSKSLYNELQRTKTLRLLRGSSLSLLHPRTKRHGFSQTLNKEKKVNKSRKHKK